MLDAYFLGANTPRGFVSLYDGLLGLPGLRRLRILKGGPGCGKSTLMKTLAARAEAAGLRAERILCSSDPDSLDGLLLPELGLGFADGTAPHVLEPPLCGCGADYLELGRFYDAAALAPAAAALRAAKEENRRCYGPAYACLRAAAALRGALRGRALEALGELPVEALVRQLLPRPLPPSPQAGGLRRVFLRGVTPQGLLNLPTGAAGLWAIEDAFGLGGPVVEALAARWQAAGYDVVLAMDPLQPGAPAGLLVPAAGAACCRCEAAFPLPETAALRLDCGELAARALGPAELARLESLRKKSDRLLAEAVRWLARAKQAHDELEALYRPAVDFAGLDALTRELIGRELPPAEPA